MTFARVVGLRLRPAADGVSGCQLNCSPRVLWESKKAALSAQGSPSYIVPCRIMPVLASPRDSALAPHVVIVNGPKIEVPIPSTASYGFLLKETRITVECKVLKLKTGPLTSGTVAVAAPRGVSDAVGAARPLRGVDATTPRRRRDRSAASTRPLRGVGATRTLPRTPR